MKLNFFSRVFLAITDFRIYTYVVQKEKFINAFAYFLCFIFLVSALLATNTTVKIVNWLSEFSTVYTSEICQFKIKEGELEIEKNIDTDFLGTKIYTDDKINIENVDLSSIDVENYKVSILAFKDAYAIGNPKYGFVSFRYRDTDMNIDKYELFELMTTVLNKPSFKIGLLLFVFCIVFVSYTLSRIVYIFFITLMLMFLGVVFRVRYKFNDYLKIAFYIPTLPTITEIAALMLVGELNGYANITYYLLTYIYMFYAVRALKLDNIITTTQEKIMSIKTEAENVNSVLEKNKDKDIQNDSEENKKGETDEKEHTEEKAEDETKKVSKDE